MIQIARTWRVFAGGMATGFIGVVLVTAGKASADPLLPPPPIPAPVSAPATVPPVQNLTALPGGSSNRFSPAPAPAPIASPIPVGAPGSTAVPPLPPPVTPAISGTLRDHLREKGVKLEAQRPHGFKALDITLPMPPRWTQVPDPNVPDAFVVIADRLGNSVYTSNAQLVVYRLIGDFDPAEAITHGYIDSQEIARMADHKRLDGQFRRLSVINHRGHLPRKRHDPQHLPAPRHRHLRSRQVPGFAVGDHRAVAGGHRRAGHRCDCQRIPSGCACGARSGACPGTRFGTGGTTRAGAWVSARGHPDTSPAALGRDEAEQKHGPAWSSVSGFVGGLVW